MLIAMLRLRKELDYLLDNHVYKHDPYISINCLRLVTNVELIPDSTNIPPLSNSDYSSQSNLHP